MLKKVCSKETTQGLTTEGAALPPLSIYVHWPYCAKICPYCDFNRYLARPPANGQGKGKDNEGDGLVMDHQRMANAYLRELEMFVNHPVVGPSLANRRVVSIFFGGGTPSLAQPSVFEAVIKYVRKTWKTSDDLEITMEANPTSVEAKRLADFRASGINRLSIGVQSLRPDDLVFLGRSHSPQEAIAAVTQAKKIFPRISMDLIYARHKNHTVAEWRKELQEGLDLADGHISLYALTLEAGTPFHRRANKHKLQSIPTIVESANQTPNFSRIPHPHEPLVLPDEETTADFYQTTVETAEGRGYMQYEISNFAREGNQSKHNLAYWRSHDWIGCGPGAHSRLTIPTDATTFSRALSQNFTKFNNETVTVTEMSNNYSWQEKGKGTEKETETEKEKEKQRERENDKNKGSGSGTQRFAFSMTRHPSKWQEQIEQKGHAIHEFYHLNQEERIEEVLLNGLRIREGISHELFKFHSGGKSFDEILSSRGLETLEEGYIVLDETGLRPTRRGMAVLNALLPHLLPP
jgi:putative oxygen-independent coproporphyrinogen III oxidase